MPKPEHVKCENCVYWEPEKDDTYIGMCRRFPPVPAEIPQRLADGIGLIASAVSGIDEDDDKIQRFIEPGYILEYSATAQSYKDGWCGEFRSSWQETA